MWDQAILFVITNGMYTKSIRIIADIAVRRRYCRSLKRF